MCGWWAGVKRFGGWFLPWLSRVRVMEETVADWRELGLGIRMWDLQTGLSDPMRIVGAEKGSIPWNWCSESTPRLT